MALTSSNLPQQGAAVKATAEDPWPGITARPLQSPDFIALKPKNPNVRLRWVNRVAGDGMRMDEMSYAGFEPVKPDEVTMPNGTACPPALHRDGKVIKGDLICMKISRVAYDGALKSNFMRATSRLHSSTQLKNGQAQLRKVMQETGANRNPSINSKLQAFQPGERDKDFPEESESAENLKLGSERKE